MSKPSSSIDYVPYTSAHGESLIALWNLAMGPDFPMDQRLWRQNVDQCERTFPAACWVAVDGPNPVGFAVGKSPNHVSVIAVHPEHRRQGIGHRLLDLATEALTGSDGRKRAAELAAPNDPPAHIITGQDYSHFFPGVPDSFDGAFAFFQACGWRKSEGWCVDLWRDLRDYRIDPPVAEKIAELAGQGIDLRSCTAGDVDSLLRHIKENYSTRWYNDTKSRIAVEPDPSDIKIAVRNGEVIGFAHTFTNKSVRIGPSILWRGLMGPEYGGLGPIGVGKDVRKIGLGLALLAYAIDEVRKAGMTRMAIDWTVLVDFYKRVGFDVWKRYVWCMREI